MDLATWNSGTPSTKTWLKPVAFSLEVQNLTADEADFKDIDTDSVCYHNVASVINPPVGDTCYFTDLSGVLNATNSVGATVQYLTGTPGSSGVVSDGKSVVQGNSPEYVDTTGTVIGDSGVNISELKVSTQAISNVSRELAPAGQRDFWQATTTPGTMTGQLVYWPDLDIVFVSEAVTGLNYSTDGGATFSPCIFDIAPTGFITVGYRSDLAVAINDAGETYTSADGINFVQGPENLGIPPYVYNILWDDRLGLFFYQSLVDLARVIVTSPNGINWTSRASTNKPWMFARNDSIIVSTCSDSPYSQYSTDGITWTDSATVMVTGNNIAWSEDQKEFLRIDNFGEGWASSDGINWTFRGVIAPGGLESQLMWVGGAIQRWYLGHNDTSPGNNISLWSSPSSREQFVPTHLDSDINMEASATATGIAYSVGRNSFMLGSFDSPYFFYSTLRPLTVKSVGDSILVRGNPPVSAKLTVPDTCLPVTNTTVQESLWTEAVPLIKGNTVFNTPIPNGMSIRVKSGLNVVAAAGSTLTVRYKLNSSVILTETFVGPIVSANYIMDTAFAVADNTASLIVLHTLFPDGDFPQVQLPGFTTFDGTTTNTLTFTAQWSAASPSNIATCYGSIVDVSYP